MARQNQASEHNTFVKGLVTEASPLTFPPDTAIDLSNLKLGRDGTLKRRLGLDVENSFSDMFEDSDGLTPLSDVIQQTFVWSNVDGIAGKVIVVVQSFNKLYFFRADGVVTIGDAGSLYATHTLPVTPYVNPNYALASIAEVDGMLIVAYGGQEVMKFEWNGSTVTSSSFSLKTRDVFGVADIYNNKDLRTPEYASQAPYALGSGVPDEYYYNLRNSGWGVLRKAGDAGNLTTNEIFDPIKWWSNVILELNYLQDDWTFLGNGTTAMAPPYSAVPSRGMFPDPNDGENRVIDRFFPEQIITDLPSQSAPNGYFVIDLLKRGTSRLSEVLELQGSSDKFQSIYDVSTLPQDETTIGATCVAEFGGRAWYGGFGGSVVDGDSYSPKLQSYVTFSQLVQQENQLGMCYGEEDPTAKESAGPLDTDGGFIRLDGAYGIKAMANIGASLYVLAENGVWLITGGRDSGFTATDYTVVKVTDKGIANPQAYAVVDNQLIYCAWDSIYLLKGTEIQNLSVNTVQSLYKDINKANIQCLYDSFEKEVYFCHSFNKELILNIELGAFYKNNFDNTMATGEDYRAGCPFQLPTSGRVYYLMSRGYLGAQSLPYKFSFGYKKNEDFRDWSEWNKDTLIAQSPNNLGTDNEAFLITGYSGLGDYQREKQVPYITFHFERTESGFDNDFNPLTPSSCLAQAQWQWANSANSGKWGREFQAYRYARPYQPVDSNDPFDTGFSVIETKNKLRGSGKVVSIKLRSEPEKDLRLLGWSMLTGFNTNV